MAVFPAFSGHAGRARPLLRLAAPSLALWRSF